MQIAIYTHRYIQRTVIQYMVGEKSENENSQTRKKFRKIIVCSYEYEIFKVTMNPINTSKKILKQQLSYL